MAIEQPGNSVQEVIAARLGALLALQIAQMMNPHRTTPWKQQELITALCDRGLGSKEIVLALGISRTIVDPTLSRYRKTKQKRRTRSTQAEN